MAERKPLFMDQTEGFSEEMATSDSMTLGGLTVESGGNIALSGGGEVTGLPATPSGATAAASKAYVDQLVVTGGPAKGAVLHTDQLDGTAGIFAATALTFQAQPVSGDNVTLSDGTTTRTYQFGTGGDVTVTIGATVADSMQNLADAIEADGSAIWGANLTTNLDAINSDGVIVIYEDSNTGTAPYIYGTWTTQANVEFVDFTDETEYVKKTLDTLPTTASATNFGLRVVTASLVDGELRYALESDILYSWDDSTDTWITLSSSAGIPDATSASGGGVKGKVTFDSDKGLDVIAGVAEVDIDEVTLDFNAGTIGVTGLPSQFEINEVAVSANVTAANLGTLTAGASSDADALHTHDGLADAVHSHAHADTTGQTANDHHNQQHAIDGADHTASGLTTGHVLTATSATTFAFQAPADDTQAERTAKTYTTATDATAVGDPVYVNGNDTVGKALASSNATARVLGIIESGAGAAGATPLVVTHGIATNVLSGATANTPYYLQAGGGIGTALPGAGNRVILVGYAVNATDLFVDIRDYAKKAA